MNKPAFSDTDIDIYHGDAAAVLAELPAESVQMCVTSPPFWGLRDYGVDEQIGKEATPELFVARLVNVFREVRRVLKDDATLWLNLGDSYQSAKGQAGGVDPKQPARRYGIRPNDVAVEGLKSKDLCMIPARVAMALQADGWYLRSDIIWHKPNPMPESVTDRPTKSHEYLFLLSKSDRYFYDADAIAEKSVDEWTYGQERRLQRVVAGGGALSGGCGEKISQGNTRNRRSVWTVATNPYPGAHFATFPPALIEPCIKAGSRPGDVVLDPFNGSGTTGSVCRKWGRRYLGIELNRAYIDLSAERFRQGVLWGAGAA